MKKIYIYLTLLLVLHVNAQQEINTSFVDQMTNMFSPLDKNRIPHGILLDFAMEFTNLPAFNGTLSDSTYVTPKSLKEIYHTLLMGRIRNVTVGMVSPQQFEDNWFNQRTKEQIVLSGLYFKYNRFFDNALTTNKLTYTNNKFYDRFINGVWQNPYQEMKTFAITTPIDIYSGKNLAVRLPQNLFYSNYENEVQKIEIDFADGLGYRQIHYNTDLNVNYAQAGNKIWKYKLTLTNGQVMLSHSKIKILDGLRISNVNNETLLLRNNGSTPWNNCDPANTDLYRLDLESTGTFLGQKGKARIFIDDAGNDCQITKPLIVIEGFDFTTLLSPESRYNPEDYIKFKESVLSSNSPNLSNLLAGSTQLFGSQQYDIIYINWDNGLDFIERNALVVEEVIKWVNTVKVGNDKIVVLGQSMGGVVGRYALRDMEQRGLTHDVRLFISQDSPQQGANVPLSIQYLYRNARNQMVKTALYNYIVPIFTSTQPFERLFSLLDQPATKQLLMNRAESNYSINNIMHDTFYANLNNKGFPQQAGIRNVAISNGSECGSLQNFNAGDLLIEANGYVKTGFIGDIIGGYVLPVFGFVAGALVDPSFFAVGALNLLPGSSRFDAKLEDRALYSFGGNKIHHFSLSYKKRILWLIPVTVSIFNVQKHQPSNINLHFDNYGGGFIDIAGYTGTSGGSGSSSIPWVYSAGYSYAVRDKFNLVPTPSALAINATQDSHFKTSFVGQNPPTGILSTGFHNFSTAFKRPFSPNNNNERHLEFNSRNGNWLADELNDNPTFTNCSFFCNNGIISGPNSFCSSAFFSVPDGALFYNWEILQGSHLVTLSDNGTRQVNLTRSNNLSGYLTLRVTYGDNNPSRCGNATFEKEIWVGTLNFHSTELFDHSTMLHISPIANNPMNNCTNIGIKVNFWPLDQTVIEYQWEKVTQDVYWHRDFDNSDTSNRVLIFPTCNKNFAFKVRARNACGWSQWFEVTYQMNSCSNDCPPVFNGIVGNNFMISPNPVYNGNVNVSIKHNAPWFPNLYPSNPDEFGLDYCTGVISVNNRPIRVNISITNQLGVVLLNFPNTQMSANLNISSLPSGNYIIVFEHLGQIESHQIIKH